MKRSLVTSGIVGAFALTFFSAATALAHAGNLSGSEPKALSATTRPLVLVHAGGGRGGGFGGGSHGFSGIHGGPFGGGHGFYGHHHFRGGFSTFGGSYYDDDYRDSGCW